MKLYNSLSNSLEEFAPINPPHVGVYTCGPTVYDYPHIGNWRTYTTADLLVRTLKSLGYGVTYVMNLTDVGHLSGDNEGDADQGEDRLEKGARREGKTAWEVADFYSKDFITGFEEMNLVKPKIFAKATEHIEEQIALIQRIEKAGFTYNIDDGIYFDVEAYEKAGNKYGELSNLDQIKVGARVEPNPQKKDPRDFALWKFSPKNEKRHMEWDSPWGVGFPGWHIECSAMSMKYLGEQFDIHVGGEDIKSTHHPNEIAQSEAATEKKPFVKYWVHGAFLTVDGGRMGKSLGNAYTLKNIRDKGYSVFDLKYFYYSGHYKKQINFTWEALDAAAISLKKLKKFATIYRGETERTMLSNAKLGKVDDYREKFKEAVSNDLNIPEALSVVWQVVKSNIPNYDKYDLLVSFDEVLSLGLSLVVEEKSDAIPEYVTKLLQTRSDLRKQDKFAESDQLRKEIEELGFSVEDTERGPVVRKI